MSEVKSTLYCSFCGKSQHEVRRLIAGPVVFICNECVTLCMGIVEEEERNALRRDERRQIAQMIEEAAACMSGASGRDLFKRKAAIGVFAETLAAKLRRDAA